MTEAAPANSPPAELRFWFEAWKSCAQDVLAQVSGQPNSFETVFEPIAVADSDLLYTLTVTGAVQGEMALRLPADSGVRLARKFLGENEPVPSAEAAASSISAASGISDENREALEELLRQIGGLAATAVGEKAGGTVQFQMSRAETPWAWTSDHIARLRTRDEGGNEIAIEIRVSPALAAALIARAQERAAPAPQPAAPAAPADATAGPATESPPVQERDAALDPPSDGYRRLLDVGLGVKLRFGTRRMVLRDVLALSSGLVVELDNKLNSPVDLLLDGRVIARGEVVVIDGKYGLRVTDVADAFPPEGSPL